MTGLFKRISQRFDKSGKGTQVDYGGPEKENTVMIEAFEWYSPTDGQHWKRLQSALPSFKLAGVDKIWIPPACKAGFQGSNGYDIYDLYDLGEFDQKGTVRTKWGFKTELIELANSAKSQGIGLVFDAVLNHKAAADYTERIQACKVQSQDRRKALEKPHEIVAWVGYNYDARNGRYSGMKYNAGHFNATGYDHATQTDAIYKFADKEWSKDVDQDLGNFDYLLCNNVDLSCKEVRDDLRNWSDWICKELGVCGFRFDAAKHMSQGFMSEYVQHIRETRGPDFFLVAEYCTYDNTKLLAKYIKSMGGQMRIFDFPLVRNFTGISRDPGADLRFCYGDTLAEIAPQNAVVCAPDGEYALCSSPQVH